MKASDLLALVQESSKGTKHVDGEVKIPSYDNMNTPDNHVSGKGTKEVKNAKKDMGKKRDKKNPANPGKPSKKERGRDMGGPGKSYKRMGEQREQSDMQKAAVIKHEEEGGEPTHHPHLGTQQELQAGLGSWIADYRRAKELGNAKMAGEIADAIMKVAQEKGLDLGMLHREMHESVESSDSMSAKQPVKNRGAVSKTAKVRGKVSDEPENKGDPGKPKNDGKSVMGPGASPPKAKEVHEALTDLEGLLGRKLNLKKKFTEERTLVRVQRRFVDTNRAYQKKGFGGVGENPKVQALDPNDEYPAPWRIVSSSEGPNSIYAANGKMVADWLNDQEAEAAMREAGQLTEARLDELRVSLQPPKDMTPTRMRYWRLSGLGNPDQDGDQYTLTVTNPKTRKAVQVTMDEGGLKDVYRKVVSGPEPDLSRVLEIMIADAAGGGAVGTPEPSPRRAEPNVYKGKVPDAPDWGIEDGDTAAADDEGRETFRRF